MNRSVNAKQECPPIPAKGGMSPFHVADTLGLGVVYKAGFFALQEGAPWLVGWNRAALRLRRLCVAKGDLLPDGIE